MKINSNNSINFKANTRVVRNYLGEIKYRTNTWFFRADLDWDNFTKYADKNFKKSKKVQIINFACSDGEESYSLVYKLIKNVKENVNKFFPVYASDYDATNITKAKSSEPYYIDCYEAEKIKEFGQSFLDYFDIFYDDTGYPIKIKPLDNIKDKVLFKKSNVIEESGKLPKSEKIILFRNCMPYLSDEDIDRVLNNLKKICAKNSLLVIGDFDCQELIFIKEKLMDNGFMPTQLKNVYKRTSKIVEKFNEFINN